MWWSVAPNRTIKEVLCKEPKLIIEVLSNSTATHDRTKKRLAYQQIESLEEYLLIAQEVQHVTLYRRAEGWATAGCHQRNAECAICRLDAGFS